MLRTNLSTRPFYNDRAIHVAIGIAAVLLTALTIWNVVRVITLSRQNTELATRVNRDHDEAEQLTRMAAQIRGGMNKEELQQIAESARAANALIDQRTFSWTAFFNHIEETMPPDVMLSSVRPAVKEGTTTVLMQVLGRRTQDIDEFIEKLEATGAFEGVVPTQTTPTDEGFSNVTLQAIYTGKAEAGAATTAPAGAPAPASVKPGGGGQ